MEVPRPKLHSASEYSMSGRIRTRSVQPNAIRSAQGRACVHRGALSPEHSRSHPHVLSEVEILPLVLSRDSRKLPSTPMRQPATRHADTGLRLQRVNRPPTMLLTT